MSNGFVYLRPLSILAVRTLGAYSQSSLEAWGKVFAWLDETGQRSKLQAGYGLMRDNPADVPAAQCRYDAAIEVQPEFADAIPATFQHMRLPGGAYARKRQIGSDQLRTTISSLRDSWMPSRGLSLDPKRPFIEIYLDDPAVVPKEKRRVDICLPVSAGQQASDAT